MTSEIIRSSLLLFILLNPFLMVVYMMDIIKELDRAVYMSILLRVGVVSSVVFLIFAWTGEAIFTNLLQARFESLQIFGGIIFLLIGVQFVFTGKTALVQLRGQVERVFGSITMPLMIGPGTISASILVGNKLSYFTSSIAILLAVWSCIIILILLKDLHDFVLPRNEPLIERYVEITGRVTALIIGTFSIEMIMNGILSRLSA